jgi:hypothetical protein
LRRLVSPVVRREYGAVVRTMFATYWTVLVVGIVLYLLIGLMNG